MVDRDGMRPHGAAPVRTEPADGLPADGSRWARVEAGARLGVVAVSLITAVHGVLAHRALYADGANMVLQMSRQGSVWFSDLNRAFSAVVMQAPAALGLKLGVTDVGTLSTLVSVGLIGSVTVAWVVALLLLRRSPAFWPMAAAFAVAELGTAMIPVGEFHLSYALVALAVALLLRPGPMRGWSAALLLAVALTLTRTYESTAYLGPILYVCAVVRGGRLAPGARFERRVLHVAAFLFAGASALGLWAILVPRDPGNAAGAAGLRLPLLHDHQLQIGAVVAVLLVARLWLVRRHAMLVDVAGTVVALALLVPRAWAVPEMHYLARTVSGLAFAGFVVVAALVVLVPSGRWAARQLGTGWVPVLALTLVSAVPLTVHTVGLERWLGTVECVVVSSEGEVPLGEAGLDAHDTSLYGWSWTNPILSELMSDGSRGGVLLNPGAATVDNPPPPLPDDVDTTGRLVRSSCP